MATIQTFPETEIRRNNPMFSRMKSLVETAFYANNVTPVNTIQEAYERASTLPNTIVLDHTISHAEELGLNPDTKVILNNGHRVVGRTAAARRILGQDNGEADALYPIVMDALYAGQTEPFISGRAIVGLEEDFMVEAHIMMPETYADNLYSWLLNFQIMNDEYQTRYDQSKSYNETDIYLYFNPDWKHPDYPDGLAIFDPAQNVAIVLGMQYFGEIKKGTLTLAWATAARNNYVACHGGLKIFRKEGQDPYVTSFFGLSGSGKSTLTHAKHEGKYDIQVLHDDAFIIHKDSGNSIALEPAYFDKTNDYPTDHVEQEFFLTVQNVAVTLNEDHERVLLTEDLRNGNGRTVKSRYSTPNRVDKIDEPINSIFWIMKDETLPPVIKINDPVVASTLGCTLVTKRSSAENVKDRSGIVVEPYANPFRVYPLVEDYQSFKDLFAKSEVDCYIINTGSFQGKDITPAVTLGIIEAIVDKTANFEAFPYIDVFEYLNVDGYEIPTDSEYKDALRSAMEVRLDFINNTVTAKEPDHPLPAEVSEKLQAIVDGI
ncbi:phosphoenolpyruvate carboxykinase (ATP) [Fundicoccus culcitae]|uniref:phosphoenolpyruvate carboxykinase (ATP) n=1 Tax=Fundicoccus culcitae TaxID=2969821 RepID=A0ABY5P5G1_9LACT|nr:phosphoenolpyruvate carboxykinase (ATP) [Fundicoccus culcitae]UUX33811.1 phosphoenolpyruvate carboxykinase (ATP) [Fundicoccus culcitae]